MPWRDTDLLGYIVDTIDGTTAIAAYEELAFGNYDGHVIHTSNDERVTSHISNTMYHSANIGFPLTFNPANIKLSA
jgi:hypothetical protein